MNVYKLEILIIDDDINTPEEAVSLIESTRYSNHVNVVPVTCREADIGVWDDDNKLNYDDTIESEMNRLFPIVEDK